MGWQLLIIAAFLDSQLTAPDVATLVMHTIYIIKFFWYLFFILQYIVIETLLLLLVLHLNNQTK